MDLSGVFSTAGYEVPEDEDYRGEDYVTNIIAINISNRLCYIGRNNICYMLVLINSIYMEISTWFVADNNCY